MVGVMQRDGIDNCGRWPTASTIQVEARLTDA